MKRHELDQAVKRYILQCVDEGNRHNAQTIIENISERFHSEYQWNIDRKGAQKAMTEWLQGLALPIAYTNFEILQLAVSWGSLSENATEREQDKILDNYWRFMAAKVLQLMDGYHVPNDY